MLERLVNDIKGFCFAPGVVWTICGELISPKRWSFQTISIMWLFNINVLTVLKYLQCSNLQGLGKRLLKISLKCKKDTFKEGHTLCNIFLGNGPNLFRQRRTLWSQYKEDTSALVLDVVCDEEESCRLGRLTL